MRPTNDQLACRRSVAHTRLAPCVQSLALELMNEPTTLGPFLRRERERRGLTLKTISEKTKVSVALLEGLETDDISRWPGGIFRRAFVRSYAECVGLDSDDVVRRFEQQHKTAEPEFLLPAADPSASTAAPAVTSTTPGGAFNGPASTRTRLLGTAADLTVAMVVAFGSAAAGSRLLWPVLLIAAYYALGVLLTGTSPMVALLGDRTAPRPAARRPDQEAPPVVPAVRPANERRHESRRAERARHRRRVHARAN